MSFGLVEAFKRPRINFRRLVCLARISTSCKLPSPSESSSADINPQFLSLFAKYHLYFHICKLLCNQHSRPDLNLNSENELDRSYIYILFHRYHQNYHRILLFSKSPCDRSNKQYLRFDQNSCQPRLSYPVVSIDPLFIKHTIAVHINTIVTGVLYAHKIKPPPARINVDTPAAGFLILSSSFSTSIASQSRITCPAFS